MVRKGIDLLRLEVESRSTPGKWYQTDLSHYRGNGSCECPHFECRKRPHLEKGELPGDHMRCEHIKEARLWLLEHALAQLTRTLPYHEPPA